jgi:hypothetical protein
MTNMKLLTFVAGLENFLLSTAYHNGLHMAASNGPIC